MVEAPPARPEPRMIGIAARARSGKDTVAAMLSSHSGVRDYALAEPVKQGCQVLFGLSDQELWDDRFKELPLALWGQSPRELFQRLGTEWMRNRHPDHWLRRAQRHFQSTPPLCSPTPVTFAQSPDTPFRQTAQAFFGLSDAQTWEREAYEAADTFWHMTPRAMTALIERLTLQDFPDYHRQRAQRPLAAPTRDLIWPGPCAVVVIKDVRFENEAAYIRQMNGEIWHLNRDGATPIKHHSSELGIKVLPGDTVIENNGTLGQLASAVEQRWQAYCMKYTIQPG